MWHRQDDLGIHVTVAPVADPESMMDAALRRRIGALSTRNLLRLHRYVAKLALGRVRAHHKEARYPLGVPDEPMDRDLVFVDAPKSSLRKIIRTHIHEMWWIWEIDIAVAMEMALFTLLRERIEPRPLPRGTWLLHAAVEERAGVTNGRVEVWLVPREHLGLTDPRDSYPSPVALEAALEVLFDGLAVTDAVVTASPSLWEVDRTISLGSNLGPIRIDRARQWLAAALAGGQTEDATRGINVVLGHVQIRVESLPLAEHRHAELESEQQPVIVVSANAWPEGLTVRLFEAGLFVVDDHDVNALIFAEQPAVARRLLAEAPRTGTLQDLVPWPASDGTITEHEMRAMIARSLQYPELWFHGNYVHFDPAGEGVLGQVAWLVRALRPFGVRARIEAVLTVDSGSVPAGPDALRVAASGQDTLWQGYLKVVRQRRRRNEPLFVEDWREHRCIRMTTPVKAAERLLVGGDVEVTAYTAQVESVHSQPVDRTALFLVAHTRRRRLSSR